MSKEIRSRTFKSGNSIALRLPKALGIAENVEMRVREEQGRYIVEPVAEELERIDLTGIWGSIPRGTIKLGDRSMKPRKLDWGSEKFERD